MSDDRKPLHPWTYDLETELIFDAGGEHIGTFEPASGYLAAAAPELFNACVLAIDTLGLEAITVEERKNALRVLMGAAKKATRRPETARPATNDQGGVGQ